MFKGSYNQGVYINRVGVGQVVEWLSCVAPLPPVHGVPALSTYA